MAAENIIHPNVRNSEGMTPLHIAAIRGYEEMTNLLLRRGAQADVKNYTQMRAPLHFACQYNHPRVCITSGSERISSVSVAFLGV